jgi:hypothetical protein
VVVVVVVVVVDVQDAGQWEQHQDRVLVCGKNKCSALRTASGRWRD